MVWSSIETSLKSLKTRSKNKKYDLVEDEENRIIKRVEVFHFKQKSSLYLLLTTSRGCVNSSKIQEGIG